MSHMSEDEFRATLQKEADSAAAQIRVHLVEGLVHRQEKCPITGEQLWADEAVILEDRGRNPRVALSQRGWLILKGMAFGPVILGLLDVRVDEDSVAGPCRGHEATEGHSNARQWCDDAYCHRPTDA